MRSSNAKHLVFRHFSVNTIESRLFEPRFQIGAWERVETSGVHLEVSLFLALTNIRIDRKLQFELSSGI